MFSRVNLIIGGIAIAILLSIGVLGGWQLRRYIHPDKPVTHDTISIQDNTWHHKYDSLSAVPAKEVYKWLPRDTVKLPGDTIKLPVDSTVIKAMLKDYLATYDFGHEFVTDSLDANVGVRVNRNHPTAYSLDYKFKIPFTTIINKTDNTVTYNSYLQAGLNMPLQKDNFNRFNVEATMTFPKWYGGAGYQPFTNTWSVKAGATLIKFKQKK